jgi:hypothetical protein
MTADTGDAGISGETGGGWFTPEPIGYHLGGRTARSQLCQDFLP